MRIAKCPQDSQCEFRKSVVQDQVNPRGYLLGGVLLSWMDEVAHVSAKTHSGSDQVLTVNIDQIHFKLPIKKDDHLLLSSSVDYVGQSSMEIGVKVERERASTGEKDFAAFALFTFVALDSNSKPILVPRIDPRTKVELQNYESAKMRIKVRGKIRKWFEERFPKRAALELTRSSI